VVSAEGLIAFIAKLAYLQDMITMLCAVMTSCYSGLVTVKLLKLIEISSPSKGRAVSWLHFAI